MPARSASLRRRCSPTMCADCRSARRRQSTRPGCSARVNGEPLVRRAAATLAAATDTLIVVVGSEAAAVRDALAGVDARIVPNDQWTLGLAGSVRAGIAALDARATAVLIALGDQPTLDPRVMETVLH